MGKLYFGGNLESRSVGGFHSIWYATKLMLRLGPLKMWRAMRSRNACKTCALGMGGQNGGMVNEAGRFPEVCKKSFQAMGADLAEQIPESFFQNNSIADIAKLTPRELEHLGRLAFPVVAEKGATHYRKISWSEAFDKIAGKISKTDPKRSFFYFSGRSSNEAGFLLQLFARCYGTNHVNNCSYYCHQASGVGLTGSIGSGTATVNLEDVENCDLFILIGANPSSNHPRLLTSLMKMKKNGGKVIVINPAKEPGLVRFKIPSNIWSLFFGTKIADHYFQPHIGGDSALLIGLAKQIISNETYDTLYVQNYTEGFLELKGLTEQTSWDEIFEASGLNKSEFDILYSHVISSKRMIWSWAMGITHHLNGVDNVQNIVNISLLRGMVGKPYSGLLPLRGHSNVQGMGTIGVTPKLKEAIFKKITDMGIVLPEFDGFDTMRCIEAAAAGDIDLAFCLGGNLFGSNPDLNFAEQAFKKIGLVSYMNTTLNTGHGLGLGEETLILPVHARDEESQKTTQESMFNFIRVSDGGKYRVPTAKSEVDIVVELAVRVFAKNSQIKWEKMRDYKNIRQLIANCVPGLEELDKIKDSGGEFTIPGRIHHAPSFKTPSKKAKFHAHKVWKRTSNDQSLMMMTVRSEGQFNTVVYEEEDVFRGIERRDVVLLNSNDLAKLNLIENQKVNIKSQTGEINGYRVNSYDVREGNCLMYFPEASILIPRDIDPKSFTPAFKATKVTITSL